LPRAAPHIPLHRPRRLHRAYGGARGRAGGRRGSDLLFACVRDACCRAKKPRHELKTLGDRADGCAVRIRACPLARAAHHRGDRARPRLPAVPRRHSTPARPRRRARRLVRLDRERRRAARSAAGGGEVLHREATLATAARLSAGSSSPTSAALAQERHGPVPARLRAATRRFSPRSHASAAECMAPKRDTPESRRRRHEHVQPRSPRSRPAGVITAFIQQSRLDPSAPPVHGRCPRALMGHVHPESRATRAPGCSSPTPSTSSRSSAATRTSLHAGRGQRGAQSGPREQLAAPCSTTRCTCATATDAAAFHGSECSRYGAS